MKLIITGATGMVGEGVLLDCLQNDAVTEVLSISRRPYPLQHTKLKELIVPDFTKLDAFTELVKGYDACFFCAGVSSVGMKEEKYSYITYTTTLAFANVLAKANYNMVFCYVSGSHTDSSEKGRIMWARVKGKTENDLLKLPFKAVYNFRPGGMLPVNGQKNWKNAYKVIVKIIKWFAPRFVLSLHEVGQAMRNVTLYGYPKHVLEISDIKEAAANR